MKRKVFIHAILLICGFFAGYALQAQMITGVWQGKINRQKVEVRIIQNGDSLAGTSYYYESPNNYRRYSIKGYFDANTNEAVWWDDHLLEEKPARTSSHGKMASLSRADFNCPGDGKMMLDGKAGKTDDVTLRGDVHLDKTEDGIFSDEWDYVLDNYLTGANDPDIIDSIATLNDQPIAIVQPPVITREPVKEVPVIVPTITPPATPPTIEEKYTTRKKVLVKEIPLTGDSVTLQFYDNAEIDGDSISLFLNNQLIFQHIRLLGTAYTIKLSVKQLEETNELTMVAENLGSIPPNTSYMIALVGDKRYDARLESTEGSSAMIRFVKK